MGEVVAADVGDGELAEHIVEDRGRVLDGFVVALHEPGGLEAGMGNTWAWSVKGDLHFEWFSRLLGGSFGRFLAERYAVFVNFVLPGSMRRRKATAEEMKAFRAPFEGLQARRAMQIFPGAIVGQSEWLSGLEAYVAGFKARSSSSGRKTTSPSATRNSPAGASCCRRPACSGCPIAGISSGWRRPANAPRR